MLWSLICGTVEVLFLYTLSKINNAPETEKNKFVQSPFFISPMLIFSIFLSSMHLSSIFIFLYKKTAKIQNKCIKIISSTNTWEPSDYASLKLMTFKHVHEYFSLIRFFKYYKLNDFRDFKMKIVNPQTNHSYSTRHSMAQT